MLLDMRTLWVVIVIVYALLGGLQLVLWRLQRSETAMLYWGLSQLACCAGAALFILRGAAAGARVQQLINQGIVVVGALPGGSAANVTVFGPTTIVTRWRPAAGTSLRGLPSTPPAPSRPRPQPM